MEIKNILILLALFAMIFGIIYIAITTSHREKMAMIEAGLDPREKKRGHNGLRYALLLIFVPLGILIGRLSFHKLNMEAEVCQLVFAFLFGGLGLAVNFFIERAIAEKEKGN